VQQTLQRLRELRITRWRCIWDRCGTPPFRDIDGQLACHPADLSA